MGLTFSVNTVVPGLVKTDLLLKLGRSKEEQQAAFENGAKNLSVEFVGTPEDVADLLRKKGLMDA